MFAPVGYLVVDQNGQYEDANLAAALRMESSVR
jgi:hypothetical protein